MNTKIIQVISFLVLSISSIYAYDKASVDTVYKYLSTKWSYYDKDGKKVNVTSLSWKSSGANHEVLVNSVSLNPENVYDKNGNSIIDPSKKNNSKPKTIVGTEDGVLKGITEEHNKYRRMTGNEIPDLEWNKEISDYAQEWANHLKKNNCKMKHRSGSTKVKVYGENLAWSSGKEMDPEEVVRMWYDEISSYNYANNSCSSVCGHYTQVVWKKSLKVGCGMAKCGNEEIWVCNYDPPGNYVGQKPY